MSSCTPAMPKSLLLLEVARATGWQQRAATRAMNTPQCVVHGVTRRLARAQAAIFGAGQRSRGGREPSPASPAHGKIGTLTAPHAASSGPANGGGSGAATAHGLGFPAGDSGPDSGEGSGSEAEASDGVGLAAGAVAAQQALSWRERAALLRERREQGLA